MTLDHHGPPDLVGTLGVSIPLLPEARGFRALAEFAPVGLFETDARGECLFVNRHWCELAGLRPEEAKGRGWARAVHVEDRARVLEEWYSSATLDRPFASEFRLEDPRGQVRWVLTRALAVRDDRGQITGAIGAVTDITARKRMDQRVREARTELETRVDERTRELADINRRLERQIEGRKKAEKRILTIGTEEQRRIARDLHDGLGQELTAISFLASKLNRALTSEGRSERAEADRISERVSATLAQLSGLVRGLYPLEVETRGLQPALGNLARTTELTYGISCRFEDDTGDRVDRASVAIHLYYIARESITNAIKHAGAQEILVRLARRGDRIILSVTNDGPGIPPAAERGKGAGLTFMEHRALLIGGLLNIRARDGGGTTVTCTLGVADDAA